MRHTKFPSIQHLPFSLGLSRADTKLKSLSHLQSAAEIVVTEKMDGENTTLYNDGVHARSLDSGNHPSRDYVKQIWGTIKQQIGDGYRIVGENLYAKHSILYSRLPDYFLVFAIFNPEGHCVSWDETRTMCDNIKYYNSCGILTSLKTVPLLYRGEWNELAIQRCFTGDSFYGGEQEGYVVRVADGFAPSEAKIAKFVRQNHVQTDEHWLNQPIVKNGVDCYF